VQIVGIWGSNKGHAQLFVNFQANPEAAEFTIARSLITESPESPEFA
jgi:hypothetical protein